MAKKGQKFKTWTADEKYNVIKPIIDLEISLAQTDKNTGVSNSMLHRWIKSYKENGYDGLKAKKKPGNPHTGADLRHKWCQKPGWTCRSRTGR